MVKISVMRKQNKNAMTKQHTIILVRPEADQWPVQRTNKDVVAG